MFTRACLLIVACVCGFQSAASAGQAPLTTERIAFGMSQPIYLTFAPGDPERIFILERSGRVRVMHNGQLLATPFLNITTLVSASGERGLLGIAFHPQYEANGQLFLRYNNTSGQTTVARYTVSADPNIADPVGQVLLTVPFATGIHNGGWIGFGHDGFLYITQGEGGSSAEAQNINNWRGKMLRIDVNGDDFPADPARNYAIPPGNPYAGVGVAGEDEIWAIGLRNPYRAGIDRQTGDLWIGDVGAGTREEVSFQPAGVGGKNYGWPCMEGFMCGFGGSCTCNSPALTLPIHDYTHGLGCVVTGGTVYRGCAIPSLDGTYFFGDYCSDRIWSLRYDGTTVSEFQERTAELAPGGGLAINDPVAFGEDYYGELYIVDLGGEVYKIKPLATPRDSDRDGMPDSCEPAQIGDLDRNGVVDGVDLGILLAQWFTAGTADFNKDGTVDGVDLGILLAAWDL